MIYIVRHGQTDWNLNGRYGGRIDVPLNECGIKQAKQIREELKNISFDVVFSSPLIRAYTTAQIVCDNDIIKDDRIIERNNGDLEGRLKSEITDNIENIIDFRNRINNFFDDITTNYKNKNILVVTHAGVGIYARCYFEGEPENNDYMKYKMKNCEVLKYKND